MEIKPYKCFNANLSNALKFLSQVNLVGKLECFDLNFSPRPILNLPLSNCNFEPEQILKCKLAREKIF